MNVNFNGFGENAATFIADETLTEAGVPVKMKDNGTVAKCGASENFCGVCVSVRGGYAVVQLSGYVKVKSDKKIAIGYKKAFCNGRRRRVGYNNRQRVPCA